jgi:hypothetical protein
MLATGDQGGLTERLHCSSFCARKVSSCLRGVATDRPHTDVLKFVDHLVMVTVGNRS